MVGVMWGGMVVGEHSCSGGTAKVILPLMPRGHSRLSAGSGSACHAPSCTYPCLSQAEFATISNITNGGVTLNLASPLKFSHMGVITTYQGPVPDLDVRAEVRRMNE